MRTSACTATADATCEDCTPGASFSTEASSTECKTCKICNQTAKEIAVGERDWADCAPESLLN